jgi:alpha-beta hydrolase superfamily lysophospholipase
MRTPRLDRDRQQWMFDYLVKETGRVFHWDADERVLPASVKSHGQISKHLGRIGQRIERVAAEEEAAGHKQTAFELYYRASTQFAAAQHPVLETSDEKRYLHGRCIANYEKVMELSPYPMERVEIPFDGVELQCNFHILPGRPKAPVVIFIPGCDMTKEIYPDPQVNHALDRGMHLLVMDGPGQGTSNIRETKLTAENYEQAVLAVAGWLQKREEVEADKITVFSQSMGCHWGLEVAASGDPRIKAVVGIWASYLDKYHILDTFSPRYKQLFGYLTGAKSEEELDKIVAKMTVEGREQDIKCPTLLTAGEYDARSPIELVYNFYDKINAPKELWVYEDTYHQTRLFPGPGTRLDCHSMGMDWIVEALGGKFQEGYARKTFLRSGGGGPNGAQGEDQDSMHWWVK